MCDLTFNRVTEKSNNIKSPPLAEPPKVKSVELSQRQDFEDLTLEVGTDKLSGNSNNNIESSPLANLPKSKSRELPQRQEFEDQTLEVVTHKSFGNSHLIFNMILETIKYCHIS